MLFAILIAFFSLIALVVLHELGHFILAKKFGVPVEEFGIGFPPRLFGKKIGETVYSLNLLPLGAFVKIYGEEGGIEGALSFSKKPVWQRGLILLGGVMAFWFVAIILLSIISGIWGLPTAISDEEVIGVREPKVQIFQVLPSYPAEKAGVEPLDIFFKMEKGEQIVYPVTIKEVQEFIQAYRGQEIEITFLRRGEGKEITVIPNEEGKIGVALVRTGFQVSPWYLSLGAGIQAAGQMTFGVIWGLSAALTQALRGERVAGVEVGGPIRIGGWMVGFFEMGAVHFLYFLSLISISLAIFNLLPIPALDGGRLLFLGIEKVRRKPMNPRAEQKINTAFFILLLTLLIFVTVKDVIRLF